MIIVEPDDREVAYSKNTNDDSEEVFKEMPVSIVSDLEHNQFASSERIHSLQG